MDPYMKDITEPAPAELSEEVKSEGEGEGPGQVVVEPLDRSASAPLPTGPDDRPQPPPKRRGRPPKKRRGMKMGVQQPPRAVSAPPAPRPELKPSTPPPSLAMEPTMQPTTAESMFQGRRGLMGTMAPLGNRQSGPSMPAPSALPAAAVIGPAVVMRTTRGMAATLSAMAVGAAAALAPGANVPAGAFHRLNSAAATAPAAAAAAAPSPGAIAEHLHGLAVGSPRPRSSVSFFPLLSASAGGIPGLQQAPTEPLMDLEVSSGSEGTETAAPAAAVMAPLAAPAAAAGADFISLLNGPIHPAIIQELGGAAAPVAGSGGGGLLPSRQTTPLVMGGAVGLASATPLLAGGSSGPRTRLNSSDEVFASMRQAYGSAGAGSAYGLNGATPVLLRPSLGTAGGGYGQSHLVPTTYPDIAATVGMDRDMGTPFYMPYASSNGSSGSGAAAASSTYGAFQPNTAPAAAAFFSPAAPTTRVLPTAFLYGAPSSSHPMAASWMSPGLLTSSTGGRPGASGSRAGTGAAATAAAMSDNASQEGSGMAWLSPEPAAASLHEPSAAALSQTQQPSGYGEPASNGVSPLTPLVYRGPLQALEAGTEVTPSTAAAAPSTSGEAAAAVPHHHDATASPVSPGHVAPSTHKTAAWSSPPRPHMPMAAVAADQMQSLGQGGRRDARGAAAAPAPAAAPADPGQQQTFTPPPRRQSPVQAVPPAAAVAAPAAAAAGLPAAPAGPSDAAPPPASPMLLRLAQRLESLIYILHGVPISVHVKFSENSKKWALALEWHPVEEMRVQAGQRVVKAVNPEAAFESARTLADMVMSARSIHVAHDALTAMEGTLFDEVQEARRNGFVPGRRLVGPYHPSFSGSSGSGSSGGGMEAAKGAPVVASASAATREAEAAAGITLFGSPLAAVEPRGHKRSREEAEAGAAAAVEGLSQTSAGANEMVLEDTGVLQSAAAKTAEALGLSLPPPAKRARLEPTAAAKGPRDEDEDDEEELPSVPIAAALQARMADDSGEGLTAASGPRSRATPAANKARKSDLGGLFTPPLTMLGRGAAGTAYTSVKGGKLPSGGGGGSSVKTRAALSAASAASKK